MDELNENFDMEAALGSISSDLGLGGDDDTAGTPSDGGNNLDGNGGSAGNEPAPGGANVAGDKGAVQTPAATEAAPAASGVTSAVPRTWRPEAAAEWEKLPEVVRNEITKREEDIFRGIEQYKSDAQYGKNVQGIMAPYEKIMAQYGIDPLQQVSGLMNAHYTLALGTQEQKMALMNQLVKDYNLDFQIGGQASEQTPYTDPEVVRLRSTVNELQSEQRMIQRERAEAKSREVQAEVAAFASDPANIYMKDVANDMAALVKSGKATSLKEAYDMAVWTNPVIRAKEMDRIAAERSAASIKEAQEKAAAAKKASAANVRSSAKSAGAAAPKGSMDDTLEETLREINSRGN